VSGHRTHSISLIVARKRYVTWEYWSPIGWTSPYFILRARPIDAGRLTSIAGQQVNLS